VTSDASNGGKDIDPGVRFLARIGALAGPLVRFGHARIALEDNHHATVNVTTRRSGLVLRRSGPAHRTLPWPCGAIPAIQSRISAIAL